MSMCEPQSPIMAAKINFCVPHRFATVTGLRGHASAALSICKACNKRIQLGNKIRRCKECGEIAHAQCEQHVPPTCGLPESFAKEVTELKAQAAQALPQTDLGEDMVKRSMTELAAMDRRPVPYIISALIRHIDDHSLDVEGLYRISGSQCEISKLQTMFAYGRPDIQNEDVHTCASLLKKFFRDTPVPLLTYDLFDDFARMLDQPAPQDRIDTIVMLVNKLPPVHATALALLINHLKRVSENHESNMMTATNIATVFGPTLLRRQTEVAESMGTGCRVVQELLRVPANKWDDIIVQAQIPCAEPSSPVEMCIQRTTARKAPSRQNSIRQNEKNASAARRGSLTSRLVARLSGNTTGNNDNPVESGTRSVVPKHVESSSGMSIAQCIASHMASGVPACSTRSEPKTYIQQTAIASPAIAPVGGTSVGHDRCVDGIFAMETDGGCLVAAVNEHSAQANAHQEGSSQPSPVADNASLISVHECSEHGQPEPYSIGVHKGSEHGQLKPCISPARSIDTDETHTDMHGNREFIERACDELGDRQDTVAEATVNRQERGGACNSITRQF